jgi:hypothetical protein
VRRRSRACLAMLALRPPAAGSSGDGPTLDDPLPWLKVRRVLVSLSIRLWLKVRRMLACLSVCGSRCDESRCLSVRVWLKVRRVSVCPSVGLSICLHFCLPAVMPVHPPVHSNPLSNCAPVSDCWTARWQVLAEPAPGRSYLSELLPQVRAALGVETDAAAVSAYFSFLRRHAPPPPSAVSAAAALTEFVERRPLLAAHLLQGHQGPNLRHPPEHTRSLGRQRPAQVEPTGSSWSYLACRIGNLVPIWQ